MHLCSEGATAAPAPRRNIAALLPGHPCAISPHALPRRSRRCGRCSRSDRQTDKPTVTKQFPPAISAERAYSKLCGELASLQSAPLDATAPHQTAVAENEGLCD